jgi:hypothetical protein
MVAARQSNVALPTLRERQTDFRLKRSRNIGELKMAMKGSRGGGYHSRQHVEKSVRTGTGSHSTRPGGVGQLGQKQGSHVTRHSDSDYRGERLHNPSKNFQPVKFGNEVALNVGRGGCGTGRTLYGQAGSQGTHGSVNPGQARPNRYRDPLENE